MLKEQANTGGAPLKKMMRVSNDVRKELILNLICNSLIAEKNKWGLSWAKLSQAGVKPGIGLNWLL